MLIIIQKYINKKGKYFGIFQVDSDGKKIGKLIWLDIDKFLTI